MEKELLQQRTETTKVFDLGGNKRKAVSGLGAVHYKEDYKNGNWLDIDLNSRKDEGEYWFYDKLPNKIWLKKDTTGYVIEERKTTKKVQVDLVSEGVEIEPQITDSGIKLWQKVEEDKIVRWKVKETGTGTLKFDKKAERIKEEKRDQIDGKTTSTKDNEYFWDIEVNKGELVDPNTAATSPGTAADDSGVGTAAWQAPTAVLTGTSYTYAGIGLGTYSHYLKVTNFGFSIPTGATIDGIVVEAKCGRTDGIGTTKDYRARIVKGGTIGTTDKSSATTWTGSYAGGNMQYISHGSSTEKWGETWTEADIENTGFGFALSAQNNDGEDGDTAQVQYIRITVYYTEEGGGGSVSVPVSSLAYLGVG